MYVLSDRIDPSAYCVTRPLLVPFASVECQQLGNTYKGLGIATGIKLHRINETEGAGAGEAVTYALDLKPIEYASPGPTEGVDALRELVKYMAPAPPPKTGKHRYIFVLLEPEDGQGGSKDEPQAPKERPHFGYGKQGAGVMEWARDNSLRPVAANFFYAQNKKQ